MEILTAKIERDIKRGIIDPILQRDYDQVIKTIPQVIEELYDNIPDNKRISYGIVHTIKELSQYLYTSLAEKEAQVYESAAVIFDRGYDFKSRGVSLGILSFYGPGDYRKVKEVLPWFESAAASADWKLREFAQMFFRKIIKKHPNEIKTYLLGLVQSDNANLRRFVSETLRPVQENRWFYKDPDYPLSVLKYLFKENSGYARTSVGNNLSDLSRHLPDLVYTLVCELVESGDKNSCWIAYRACRNLVKKEPVKVMDLLGVDEYRYKKRVYRRGDS